MTIPELKNNLRAFPRLNQREADIRKEIAEINGRADTLRGISSPMPDGLPHGNRISDSTYAKARKIVDVYDGEVDRLLTELGQIQAARQAVAERLKRLEPDERKVIEAYYFDKIRWDYIPARLHWSGRTCRRKRDNALRKMLK
ncbi:MAG: hypothetical protein FWF44_01860 [Defluviitaleaceae bacterium]|nr:hypothetical protein [Defluviitaleaceae bacterium]